MSREDRTVRRERKRRGPPVGSMRLKLQAPVREGYERYWFNDDPPGRIQEALDGDYEFVTEEALKTQQEFGDDYYEEAIADSPNGTRVSQIVGKNEAGEPIKAYLMEIPKEWYDEDQAEIHKQNKEVERQLMRGKVPGDQSDPDKTYIPEGMKMEIRETSGRRKRE